MKVEVQTQILSTETLSKVHILLILELIELFRTNGKVSIFSSAHFGRTLESNIFVFIAFCEIRKLWEFCSILKLWEF